MRVDINAIVGEVEKRLGCLVVQYGFREPVRRKWPVGVKLAYGCMLEYMHTNLDVAVEVEVDGQDGHVFCLIVRPGRDAMPGDYYHDISGLPIRRHLWEAFSVLHMSFAGIDKAGRGEAQRAKWVRDLDMVASMVDCGMRNVLQNLELVFR